jgi:hypothetical protein
MRVNLCRLTKQASVMSSRLRIPLSEKEKDMMQVHRSRAKEEGKKEWSSSSFFIEFIG